MVYYEKNWMVIFVLLCHLGASKLLDVTYGPGKSYEELKMTQKELAHDIVFLISIWLIARNLVEKSVIKLTTVCWLRRRRYQLQPKVFLLETRLHWRRLFWSIHQDDRA